MNRLAATTLAFILTCAHASAIPGDSVTCWETTPPTCENPWRVPQHPWPSVPPGGMLSIHGALPPIETLDAVMELDCKDPHRLEIERRGTSTHVTCRAPGNQRRGGQ